MKRKIFNKGESAYFVREKFIYKISPGANVIRKKTNTKISPPSAILIM